MTSCDDACALCQQEPLGWIMMLVLTQQRPARAIKCSSIHQMVVLQAASQQHPSHAASYQLLGEVLCHQGGNDLQALFMVTCAGICWFIVSPQAYGCSHFHPVLPHLLPASQFILPCHDAVHICGILTRGVDTLAASRHRQATEAAAAHLN